MLSVSIITSVVLSISFHVCLGAIPLFEEHSSDSILLGNVMCMGSESSILECAYTSVRGGERDDLSQCEDHAGVICQGKS